MREPDDPARLAEDGSFPSGLREALRAARSDVGSDAEVARLSQRLGAILEPPPAPVGPTGAGLVKVAPFAAMLLVIGAGGFWLSKLHRAEPPEATSLAHPPRAAEPALSVPVTPPAGSAVDDATAGVREPERAEAPPESGSIAAPTSQAPARKTGAAPAASEAELLEQARSSLAANPARALARTSEHRARFPSGVLVQEREVIAIQALRRLGRDAEADQRAEAFSKAFPGSAFQRKLKPSP